MQLGTNMIRIKAISVVLLAAAGFLATARVRAADAPALPQPIKSVLTNYFKIQTALAEDSLKGVPEAANAIAKVIKEDKSKLLSSNVVAQAEAVAEVKDLAMAREAFKPLSESLIKYLADNKVNSNSCDEFHCHMADASWLQEDTETKNPYFGTSMPGCGIKKRTF